MEEAPVDFPIEDLSDAVVGKKSVKSRMKMSRADRNEYIGSLHAAILKLGNEMAFLTAPQTLKNEQAIRTAIERAGSAYSAVESIVEESDLYKYMRDAALEKARDAQKQALSTADEVKSAFKKETDAAEGVTLAQAELESKEKKVQALKDAKKELLYEDDTESERSAMQLLLDAREKAVADAKQHLEAAATPYTDAGIEVNAAKERAKAAAEQLSTKKVAAMGAMTYKDKKRYGQILSCWVEEGTAAKGPSQESTIAAEEGAKALTAEEEARARVVEEKEKVRADKRAKMTEDQKSRIDQCLWMAASCGKLKDVEVLLANGADVNHANICGWTVLMEAACTGHVQIVEVLLAYGANVSAADSEGIKALMMAAKSGYLEIVEVLLANGANLNDARNNGGTTLMHAVAQGHTAIVQVLISKGANLNMRENDGRTALSLADNERIAEMLRAAGAQE